MRYDAILQDNGYQGHYDAEYIGTYNTEEEALKQASYAYNRLCKEDKLKCYPDTIEREEEY